MTKNGNLNWSSTSTVHLTVTVSLLWHPLCGSSRVPVLQPHDRHSTSTVSQSQHSCITIYPPPLAPHRTPHCMRPNQHPLGRPCISIPHKHTPIASDSPLPSSPPLSPMMEISMWAQRVQPIHPTSNEAGTSTGSPPVPRTSRLLGGFRSFCACAPRSPPARGRPTPRPHVRSRPSPAAQRQQSTAAPAYRTLFERFCDQSGLVSAFQCLCSAVSRAILSVGSDLRASAPAERHRPHRSLACPSQPQQARPPGGRWRGGEAPMQAGVLRGEGAHVPGGSGNECRLGVVEFSPRACW